MTEAILGLDLGTTEVKAGLVTGRLPEYGCIFFPRLVGIADTLDFAGWLADTNGVIVAPGDFFGAPGHVRIGFAHAPEVLEYGLTRFAEGLREYAARKVKGAPQTV